MLPIKDISQRFSTPHINRLLLITNIIIFTVYWLSSQNILFESQFASYFEQEFVMVPYEIVHGQHLYTLLTSMFMHASWLHLLGNMLFLYIFGDNIEDVFGHAGYFAVYILCGLVASFTQILSLTNPNDLLIGVVGASGAISGVLGAYIVLFPKNRILTIVGYIPLPLPAILFLGFWFVMQWLYGFYDVSSGVAYFAHIGGFIMGIILALAFGLKRKKALRARHRL